MIKKVKIKSYGEEKTGSNERGNWWARDVEVVWQEEGANGLFEQSQMVNVSERLNPTLLDDAIKAGTVVECRMYFTVRTVTKDGVTRKFNNVRGYLPQELELKEF